MHGVVDNKKEKIKNQTFPYTFNNIKCHFNLNFTELSASNNPSNSSRVHSQKTFSLSDL